MRIFVMAKIKGGSVKKRILNEVFHQEDQRKLTQLFEGKSFDLFIMSIILADAVVLGLMTSKWIDYYFMNGLFLLDRLFMGIFIVEMLMKLYVYRRNFFKSGWNVFDLTIVAVSSVPFASTFIVLRTFRLFRLLKYVNKFSGLKEIIDTFVKLLPNFVAVMFVFAIFFYAFAIIAVNLYGSVFVEFSSLGTALFALLQTFTLDGWASSIARPVMSVFPHAWIFFSSFVLISFLLVISFVMSEIAVICRKK